MVKKKTNMLVALIVCAILASDVVSAADVAAAYSGDTDDDDVAIVERGNEIVDTALVPVYDMVKIFLEDIVQPNDLTYMQEKGVDFSDPDNIVDSFENGYEDWIWYAIGYAVCAAIGVILILVMCCAACCTCMCRTCCGKCGGRVQPIPNPNPGESHPQRQKRVCCGIFFFIVITFVFLGSLTMYFTAVRIHSEMTTDEGLFHSLSDGMMMLDDYVRGTMDDLEEGTLGTFNETVDQVFMELDKVVTESYETLDSEAGISDNMDPLLDFTEEMPFMHSALSNAQFNATVLQAQVDQLESELDAVQSDINSTITQNCTTSTCTDMIKKIENVAVIVDYTSINGTFNNLIVALRTAILGRVNTHLKTGYAEFKAVVDEVNNSVSDEIDSARTEAEAVAGDISQELKNIEDELDSISLNGTAEDLEELSEDLKEPADYALYGMGGIAALVLFIVLFGYLGLLFDCLCPQAKPRKSDYCCTKKVGATCLLTGVGFTFIFFWILMFLLIVLMLSGGLLHTELCRHLVNLDQSPVMTIIDDIMNDTLYDDVGFSINISEIYISCRNSEAFYTALDVEETFGFDLDSILDTSAIDTEIEKIGNISITIGPLSILTPEAETLLLALAGEVDNTKGDIEDAITELGKPVTSDDLGKLANELEAFDKAEAIPGLAAHIATVRRLHNDTIDISEQKEITLHELEAVQQILTKSNLTAITIGLRNGNDTVNNNGSAIIEAVIDETTVEVEEIIDKGVSAINNSVRYDIGKCTPIYNAYSLMIDAGCVELLYPVNGYWFALGWSLFFLIISIIMSLKLATLYRRTYEGRNAIRPDIGYDKVRLAVISSSH